MSSCPGFNTLQTPRTWLRHWTKTRLTTGVTRMTARSSNQQRYRVPHKRTRDDSLQNTSSSKSKILQRILRNTLRCLVGYAPCSACFFRYMLFYKLKQFAVGDKNNRVIIQKSFEKIVECMVTINSIQSCQRSHRPIHVLPHEIFNHKHY